MTQLLVLTADHDSWPQSYGCANFLLKEGARILWAIQPFAGTMPDGQRREFERATFLITNAPAGGHPDWLSLAEQRYEIELLEVNSVEGFTGLLLRPIRVAMYGGGGAPFNHARIFAELGFSVSFISPQEVRRGRLDTVDAFGMPGGGMIAMKGQLDPLGEQGGRAIADFVRDGGMYMGSCAGSFDAAIVPESFLNVCPQQREMQLVNATIWNRNDTEWIGLESPGVGVLESRNLRPDHPVMFGVPERFRITHYNGPFFEPAPGTLKEGSAPIGLAAVTGFTEAFTPSEYFLRHSEFDHDEVGESSLVGRATREERLNIVAGHYGLGKVILFGSHPEFGYNLAMDQWDIPARMLANALFWQAGHLPSSIPSIRDDALRAAVSFPLGSGLQMVSQRLATLLKAVQRLRERPGSASSTWLAENVAMSTFGLSGVKIWTHNLAAFDDVAEELERTITQTEEFVQTAAGIVSELRETGRANELKRADAIEEALLRLEEAIHFQTPEEWGQDFGYEGILQMLERAETMLEKAEDNWDTGLEASANPYQHFDTSPYHLVVGSYLAASAVFANAWYLLRVHELALSEVLFKGRAVHEETRRKEEVTEQL